MGYNIKSKRAKKQKYRIIDIAQYLGISEKTVIKYNKISLDEKEKYEKISKQELKSQVSKNNKWELIREIQKEYQKYHKYSVTIQTRENSEFIKSASTWCYKPL